MVRIRVAYDVSFVAQFINQLHDQSGVYRTVEELLFALCKRSEIELTAVVASGDNPLIDVTNSSLYLARHKLSCRFDSVLIGRFGLANLYVRNLGCDSTTSAATSLQFMIPSAFSRRIKRIVPKFVNLIDRPYVFLDHEYDLFHSPFLKLPPRELIGKIPRMLTVYDLIFLKNPEFLTAWQVALLKSIFSSLDLRNDWVTCISEFTKQEFCDVTGMSPERVFVTPLGAADHFRPIRDLDRISEVRQKYSIPTGRYLLALSALQPRKNFRHLIRCFLRLLSDHRDLAVSLVIVGAPGWFYEEILAARRTGNDLENRIVFTGYVSNQDLGSLYSGAVGFLFPSLYEGFGLPALEAMQCGLPVIASNTTALPEVIGDAGILVDPTDGDALCQSMLNLLTNAELSRELGEKALQRSKRFSWAACAQKTVHAYTIIAGAA